MPQHDVLTIGSGTECEEEQHLINTVGLKKQYAGSNDDRIDVLDGISLNIKSGQVICVIGPSGCGKSTLLRLIAGIEKPDCGDIFFHFGNGNKLPPISMVLQTPALLPWRNVRDNIMLGLELLGKTDNFVAAENYVQLMGLNGFSTFLPKDISGGMKARVSIGRALIAASKLVLFDEAFTELDEVTRQSINDIFCQHIEQKNLAAVVVSHDIAEAVYLADEVIVLTNRPATISKTFTIHLPRPRRSSIRLSTEFINVVKPIREFITKSWNQGDAA